MLMLIAFIAFSATRVEAQIRTVGSITGTVVDTSGAGMPGASVKLKDERTGIERETVTNDAGGFSFLDLQASSYQVSVSLQGFQTTVVHGVAVESGRSTDLPVSLSLGQVTETVEVAGRTPTLQMTSNAVGTTVTNKDVQNLPLAGRSVLNFATLVPGSQVAGVDPRQSTYQGMPGATINITVDGVNNNSTAFKSGGTSFFATVPPRLDAIEEINVTTAGLGADAGAEGAMNIKFVTKRGTNAYHGSGFYQVVNEGLNANSYFNNALKLPKPRARRNEFGGSLGGPIVRNKAFFFVNWEETRSPGINASTRTVLTDEAAQGIFRYRGTDGVERTANLLQIAAANGFSGAIDPIVGGQLSQINASLRGGALSRNDLIRNTLSWNEPVKTWEHFPTGRVDYQLTKNLSLNGTTNIYDRDIQGNRQFPGAGYPAQSVFQNTWVLATGSMNWTIAPTTLLDARYGIQRNQDTYNIGEQPSQFDVNGRPIRFNFPLNLSTLLRNQLQINRHNSLQQVSANVTHVRGTHNLTFGGTFRWVSWYDADYRGGGVPQYSFGLATGDPAANLFSTSTLPGISTNDITNAGALYALLTGRLSSITAQRGVNPGTRQYQDASQLVRDDKQRNGGVFVQDQWRPNAHFSFNFGLRWQASGPVYNGTSVYTSPDEANLLGPSTALFAPGQLNGVQNPVIDLRPRTYETDWNNIAPNVGVAWTPGWDHGFLGKLAGHEKLVLRASYSKSYFDEGLNAFINYAGQNPGLIQTVSLNPGQPGFAPGGLTLSGATPPLQVFPTSYAPPFAEGDYTFGTTDFLTTQGKMQTPSVHAWNIGVQRELSENTVIEVRYVGNTATRWHGYDLNEVNIIENGFRDEFVKAQANLAINQANGRTGFANNGLPGQSPLPMFEAAFGARGSQAAVPVGMGFGNQNFINQLNTGEAGGLANALAGSSLYLCRMVGSAFAPCGKLGYDAAGPYPMNVFQANPFAAGRAIDLMADDGSFTNYNGLQLEFRRRYAKGLTFAINYSFAKANGNLFADTDGSLRNYSTLRDKSLDNGPSPFDLRHALQAYYTVELPFGRGHRLSSNNGVVDRRDWRLVDLRHHALAAGARVPAGERAQHAESARGGRRAERHQRGGSAEDDHRAAGPERVERAVLRSQVDRLGRPREPAVSDAADHAWRSGRLRVPARAVDAADGSRAAQGHRPEERRASQLLAGGIERVQQRQLPGRQRADHQYTGAGREHHVDHLRPNRHRRHAAQRAAARAIQLLSCVGFWGRRLAAQQRVERGRDEPPRPHQLAAGRIFQDDAILAVRPRLQLVDRVDVDDRRSVDARELAGIEPALYGVERAAHDVGVALGVQQHVVARRLEPGDRLGRDEHRGALSLHEEPPRIPGLR
jgi:hypothetical protein